MRLKKRQKPVKIRLWKTWKGIENLKPKGKAYPKIRPTRDTSWIMKKGQLHCRSTEDRIRKMFKLSPNKSQVRLIGRHKSNSISEIKVKSQLKLHRSSP